MIISSGITTSEIEMEITNWVGSAYGGLQNTFTIAVIAIFAALLGICVCSAIFAAKSAYVFRDTTPKKFHYSFLVGILISAVYMGFGLGRTTNLPLYIIACAFAVLAVVGLSRFKVYGLVSSFLYLWTIVLAGQFAGILAVYKDRSAIGEYSAPGKVAVYVLSDYIIAKAIIVGIFMLALSVFVVIYYSRRRYLFKAYRPPEFDSYPVCAHCGMPILENVPFCINCGTKQEGGYFTPQYKVLQTAKYCKDCGNLLNKNDFCLQCAIADADKETLADSAKRGIVTGAKEGLADIIKKVTVFAAIIAFFCIPIMAGSLTTPLMSGIAGVSNAYVSKLNEFLETPEISEDAAWLDGFNSASNALYTVNKRCFYINPRAVRHDDLIFYTLYAEASFDQMRILETIKDSVNQSDASQIDRLTAVFNNTIDEQSKALITSAGFAFGGNTISQIFKAFIDAMRFYLSLINIDILLCSFLAVGILSLIYSLVRYNSVSVTGFELFIEKHNARTNQLAMWKRPTYAPPHNPAGILIRLKSIFTGGIGTHFIKLANELFSFILLLLGFVFLIVSVFRPSNFLGLFKRFIPKPRKSAAFSTDAAHAAYKREQRKSNLIAAGIGLCVVTIIASVSFSINSANQGEPNYLEISGAMVSVDSMEFTTWLAQANADRGTAYTDENRAAAIALIDGQLQAIENVRNLENVPEQYAAFHDGMLSLCKDEEEYLNHFRTLLSAGEELRREDMANYMALRAQNYQWLITDYTGFMFQEIYNRAEDIF